MNFLRQGGLDCVSPIEQDDLFMWDDGPDDIRPTSAFRKLASFKDIEALLDPNTTLVTFSGWETFPEAIALRTVAQAWGIPIRDMPDVAFTKGQIDECSGYR